MVNNSENSQTQRVNDPRRNEARSGDHERGNARQIRGFRVLDRRRCLSPPRNPSPPPSGRRHRWPSNFFQDQVHRTVERRRSFSVDVYATTTITSPLAAGDAGAALGRGHRHTPLSRASVPPPLPSHFPLPRALALPCYRVRDPGREISQFRPVLTRFFFNEPLCFLLASLEDELFFLRTKNIRYIFYINVSYGLLYSSFFLEDLFPFSIFLLDKRHRGNLEREILFRINVFTSIRILNFHILDFS